jgi:hypothetical protein
MGNTCCDPLNTYIIIRAIKSSNIKELKNLSRWMNHAEIQYFYHYSVLNKEEYHREIPHNKSGVSPTIKDYFLNRGASPFETISETEKINVDVRFHFNTIPFVTTPFTDACSLEHNLREIEKMLGYEADNKNDEIKKGFIMAAMFNKSTEIFTYLLSKIDDINFTMKISYDGCVLEKCTPLMAACISPNTPKSNIYTLIENGADINFKNENGITPLQILILRIREKYRGSKISHDLLCDCDIKDIKKMIQIFDPGQIIVVDYGNWYCDSTRDNLRLFFKLMRFMIDKGANIPTIEELNRTRDILFKSSIKCWDAENKIGTSKYVSSGKPYHSTGIKDDIQTKMIKEEAENRPAPSRPLRMTQVHQQHNHLDGMNLIYKEPTQWETMCMIERGDAAGLIFGRRRYF